MTQHRGVLIGAGGVARLAHLPAYRHDDVIAGRLVIVGAVDPREPAPDVGVPVWRNLDDALAAGGIDFVDICTPTAAHRPLVLAALARGLHVFCEKPVAVTLADARELVGASRSADRRLFPCHQYRQNPAWRALRAWLDAGAIGRWRLAEFHVYRAEADRGAVPDGVPWRGQRNASLGGVLLDHGTHLLYLLLDVGGIPQSVTANLSRLGHSSYDVEDTAHVVLNYPGRAATLTLTWAAHARENRIRFIGDEGTAEWTGGVLRLSRRDGTVETRDFTAQLDKREYAGWMSRTLHDFADAIDAGSDEAALGEIEQTAALLDAAYRSATDGRRVALP